jgi:hypothetical protein
MPDLSAVDIRRLALANLAKRASEGKPLAEADWQRLREFERAEKPDQVGDLAAEVGRQLAEAKAAGGKLPAALVKLGREALLRDIAAHVWPDVPAAAKELGVSVQTVRNWCDEMGIAANRTAISKAELYRGLWLRDRERAAAAPAPLGSEADQREQELRMIERQARIDERTGRLVAVANDAGRAGVIAAVRDLRGALLTQLPSLLGDALAKDQDRIAWEGICRRTITSHLETICADIAQGVPSCPPTAPPSST